MKLNEFIKNGIELTESTPLNYISEGFDHILLEKIKESLMKCDEFKNVDVFEIIEIPFIANERNEIIESKTFRLSNNTEFRKKCYIHSISLSPLLYDLKALNKPVKNGACISPVMYDAINFTPKCRICIEFSPESLQESIINTDNLMKQELSDLFNDILNSPNDYMTKGERAIIIRGIFEEIIIDDNSYLENIGTLNLDYDNQPFFSVIYTSRGDKSIKLEKMLLPIELREKFEEHFKNMITVLSKDDVDEFLSKHNNNSNINK